MAISVGCDGKEGGPDVSLVVIEIGSVAPVPTVICDPDPTAIDTCALGSCPSVVDADREAPVVPIKM